jgi:exopolyphosphatase/guanosine-5'-triphosphate,3'-diphosphate pyrophosphatase
MQEEREQRIEGYREKMVGETSLWQVWRIQLPQGKQIASAALQRLRRWASVLDPGFKHSNHVARLSLQLYDGLLEIGGQLRSPEEKAREILRLAAMLHDVGRSKEGKGHHKTSYRLIERLKPPLGVEGNSLRMAGIVARYHRGALPRPGQKALRNLIPAERNRVLWLGGILRLANAFDGDRKGRISRLEVHQQDGFILIAAQGYSSRDRSAEEIAAARHLLELVVRRPVMVKALRASVARIVNPRSG